MLLLISVSTSSQMWPPMCCRIRNIEKTSMVPPNNVETELWWSISLKCEKLFEDATCTKTGHYVKRSEKLIK